MRVLDELLWTRTVWWNIVVIVIVVVQVTSLSGPHVCMVKQKYNVTKRVKYRAPMSVRTYEWCFAMPPRCSKWSTEMKDLTRLETEERTADTAVCCPGYKMKGISCVLICPEGKTGAGCLQDCPPNKWGPNCVNDCKTCIRGTCSPVTGECQCHPGWQGESCKNSLSTTLGAMMESLTTAQPSTVTKIAILLNTPISSTISPKFSTSETLTPTEATKTEEIVNMKSVPTVVSKQNDAYESLTTSLPKEQSSFITESTIERSSFYNRTETSFHNTPGVVTFITPSANGTAKITKSTLSTQTTDKTSELISTRTVWTTASTKTTTEMTAMKDLIKTETRRPDTTVKPQTTAKFKPKEIWIRPAQKGELTYENKAKLNLENKAKMKELPTEMTTPKTIVVSIIPTSVSYASFKRIFLTTASFITHKKRASSTESAVTTDSDNTKPMRVTTLQSTTKLPFSIKIHARNAYSTSSYSPKPNKTKTSHTTLSLNETKATAQSNITNSMAMDTTEKLSPPHSLTTISSINKHSTTKPTNQDLNNNLTVLSQVTTTSPLIMAQNAITEHYPITKLYETIRKNASDNPLIDKHEQNGSTKVFLQKQIEPKNDIKLKKSKFNDSPKTTKNPMKYEETFPILTEPEHITAVMGDKGNERPSIDLISVISIAGGVMMAIITVSVIIVMIERCKKPRYEDDRKYNEIRMQVMADDNHIIDSPPPPYVRSIFHTPLPDPPTLEKCHYQPISTLDRNLKQFMRPVVVQTISPLMLENFRGILECHYDHLPRRSHDCESMQTRCSVSPSVDEYSELLPKRVSSLTNSAIEAMKCEATFDVLDSTTSEPLYAEIPCWRPPSEHAVEVVNMNGGEAVTEL